MALEVPLRLRSFQWGSLCFASSASAQRGLKDRLKAAVERRCVPRAVGELIDARFEASYAPLGTVGLCSEFWARASKRFTEKLTFPRQIPSGTA